MQLLLRELRGIVLLYMHICMYILIHLIVCVNNKSIGESEYQNEEKKCLNVGRVV